MTPTDRKALHVLIEGRVQGIGFRYWVYDQAVRRGLDGWVRNLADGRVEAVFAGPEHEVDEMVSACWQGPRFSKVVRVASQYSDGLPEPGFEIRR
jgi:acylphosphatase